MVETKVFDLNGERIIKGSKVKLEWHDDTEHIWFGTVTEITDPEGDADEEGRMIAINAKVCIKWDDLSGDNGDEEIFDTNYSGGQYAGADPEYECEELEVC